MTMFLLYLAKPTYGGWVSFTAHLALKYNYQIIKLSNRTENQTRDFGYSAKYRNVSLSQLEPGYLIMPTFIMYKYKYK